MEEGCRASSWFTSADPCLLCCTSHTCNLPQLRVLPIPQHISYETSDYSSHTAPSSPLLLLAEDSFLLDTASYLLPSLLIEKHLMLRPMLPSSLFSFLSPYAASCFLASSLCHWSPSPLCSSVAWLSSLLKWWHLSLFAVRSVSEWGRVCVLCGECLWSGGRIAKVCRAVGFREE